MGTRAPEVPAGTPLRSFRRRLLLADRWAIGALLALPLLIFALPALLGHTVLLGDDFTQNYPLRAFVGSQVRHGHLPLYNPYIWSGAPLLGGWNAGAAYPLTLLFVILPATAAWTLNLVATWWVAGIGSYAFLRTSVLSPVPSFLGALSFSFAGAMTSQIVHFGLVAGISWLPLALLALLRLSQLTDMGTSAKASAVSAGDTSSTDSANQITDPGEPPEDALRRNRRSKILWTLVLAAAGAMSILAGEPRAITTAAVVIAIYGAWRAVRLGRAATPFVAYVAPGFLLAVALGAIQWIPGAEAVSTSQRASSNYYLFTSGSLPLKWLLLLFVPDALGGSGSFGQPPFLASYNLTEITGYVGILPLVAFFALLPRLRWRRPIPEWAVWHLVALIGILLALGNSTPLWHLLIHVPLFAGQRLQSRNILIADMGFAFLLAYWAQLWIHADAPSNAPASAGRSVSEAVRHDQQRSQARRRDRHSLLIGGIAPLAALVVVVVGIAWGAGFLEWMGATRSAASEAGGLRMWFLPFGVLAIVSLVLLAVGGRLEPRRRAKLLTMLVIVDVIVFTLMTVVSLSTTSAVSGSTQSAAGQSVPGSGTSSTAPTPSPGASVPTPVTELPASFFAGSGRFAIYDPDLLDANGLNVIGAPDLNVVDAVPSVQGYSSIVDGTYASVTGTHQSTGLGQNILDPNALARGVFDQLDTRVLFTPRDYLLVQAAHDTALPDPGAGERRLAQGGRATWYFGAYLSIKDIVVPDAAAASDLAAGLKFELTTLDGTEVPLPRARLRDSGTLEISLSRPAAATALLAVNGTSKSATVGSPTLTTVDGTNYVADGQLQGALLPPRWSFRTLNGSFGVFENNFSEPALYALPPSSPTGSANRNRTGASGSPRPSVRVISGSSISPSEAFVSSQTGARVVRAVAMIPGWHATWRPTNGTAVGLPLRRDGLVQAVDVPSGTGTLAWSYDPPGWTEGWVVSLAALVVLLALLSLVAMDRLRGLGHRRELDRQGRLGRRRTR